MAYNHSLEEKKFKEEWAEKAKEYRKVGISDIHITTSDEKGLTVGDYDIVNPETIE